jgi:nitrate/nitrite transport system ATP-binding protein
MAFLELRRVSKAFGSGPARTPVLKNITLEVEQGEFVAVVGYSGSGKTTLISIVAGLLSADEGEVRLRGRVIDGPGRDRGVVFQSYALLPWLTVFENVHLAVDESFASMPPLQRKAHTRRYIELVGLTQAADKVPSELSGGMRQRVAVARALAMDPEVLLMDEPLSALDALTRGTLQDEIERIWRVSRKTVLLITNDVDEAVLLADRVVPLSAGPNATLGPAVPIDIGRPRNRKSIQHDARFKDARRKIIEYLMGPGAASRRRILPTAFAGDEPRAALLRVT